MELFRAIFADFTEEDWQDVKEDMKVFMIEQFKQMWEENYIWDYEFVQDMVSNEMNDFVASQFRELFDKKDMKRLLMQEMVNHIQEGNRR